MNKGKGRATPWVPVGDNRRNHGNNGHPQNRQTQGPKEGWVVAKKMPTAKAQVNDKRLEASLTNKESYLGEPPTDREVIRARYVLASSWEVYPSAIEDPDILDGIRKQHRVWITRVRDTQAWDIYSESASGLQEAVHAFNQTVHDLRLQKELLATVLVVQQSSRCTEDARISVAPNSRPKVITPLSGSSDIKRTAAKLLQRLRPHLLNSTECAMSVDSELRMRVSFGELKVFVKHKGMNSVLSYDGFMEAAKSFSIRGGIGLVDRLNELKLPNHIIKHFLALEGDGGLQLDHNTIKRTYALALGLQRKVVYLESCENGSFDTSRAKMGIACPTKWLNWVVATPDMGLDWGIRADAYNFESVPAGIDKLIKELRLIPATYEETGDFLKPGEVAVGQAGEWKDKILETRLKTTFAIELHGTPYILEISITQIWKGLKTRLKAKMEWGIQLYGKHWDSAMNQVNPHTRRKDWGEGHKNVWVGTDPDLGRRFQNFLEVVLQLQQHVEDVPPLTLEEFEDLPSVINQ
ncbi:uncharacterized protein Triagg1_6270 [Trichoderma aggressivum f. europaeum]|uniref:Uncharacterized protein n=1 Tax=Trichoderma aggressivum f. europaeum TaxID=173218 RepID=A0AAE1J7W4_9HYPO|nr:hypothetical protein Triagg1_6270 [Trichoderma aggressivum f. europaeum]